MWWRAVVILLLFVGLAAGTFLGMGPVMRYLWEDHVSTQLRHQPSFRAQETPVLDVPAQSIPIARPAGPPPTAELGKGIYKLRCIFCHGDSGRGDGPVAQKFVAGAKVADLTAPAIQSQPDSELRQTIAQGKRIMRGFQGELAPEEIQSVVLFLRTLK